MLSAHRVLLAAASDVLMAKFTAQFADSAEHVWAPEVGSAPAWQWLVSWIYGSEDPLPAGLVVEMLVLADHFQILALVDGIKALSLGPIAEELAKQLLEVWACPDALTGIAAKCVPAAVLDVGMLARLQAAGLQNMGLFIKFVPMISEVERLRLLGASLRCKERGRREFADCLLDSVQWELFPADVLELGIAGNLDYFEALLGQPIPASQTLRQTLLRSLVARCRSLERALPSNACVHQPVALPPPSGVPSTGLFWWMVEHGLVVETFLSSAHARNGYNGPHALLSLEPKEFGTNKQSPAQEPWIELRSRSLQICPEGVGLRHGWGESDICTNFVIEAAVGPRDWITLLRNEERPLEKTPQVFRLPEESASCNFFDRFRIRMTGPTTTNTWYLMVAWFDVFGRTRSATLSGLFDAFDDDTRV